MRKLLLLLVLCGPVWAAMNPHPRIEMTPSLLAAIETRIANSIVSNQVTDVEWLNEINYCEGTLYVGETGTAGNPFDAFPCIVAARILMDVTAGGTTETTVQNGCGSSPANYFPASYGSPTCGGHSSVQYATAVGNTVFYSNSNYSLTTARTAGGGIGAANGRFTIGGAAGHNISSNTNITVAVGGLATISPIDNSLCVIPLTSTYAYTSLAILNSAIGLNFVDYTVASISGCTGTDTLTFQTTLTPGSTLTETSSTFTMYEYGPNNVELIGDSMRNNFPNVVRAFDWLYYMHDGVTKRWPTLYPTATHLFVSTFMHVSACNSGHNGNTACNTSSGSNTYYSGGPGGNLNEMYGTALPAAMGACATYGDNPLDSGGTNPQIADSRNVWAGGTATADAMGQTAFATNGVASGGITPDGSDYGYLSTGYIGEYLFTAMTCDGTDYINPVSRFISNELQAILYTTSAGTSTLVDGNPRYFLVHQFGDIGSGSGDGVNRPWYPYSFHGDVRKVELVYSYIYRTYVSGFSQSLANYIKWHDLNINCNGSYSNGLDPSGLYCWNNGWTVTGSDKSTVYPFSDMFIDTTATPTGYDSLPLARWTCNSNAGLLTIGCSNGDTGHTNNGAFNFIISRAHWNSGLTLENSTVAAFQVGMEEQQHTHGQDGQYWISRGGAFLAWEGFGREASYMYDADSHSGFLYRGTGNVKWLASQGAHKSFANPLGGYIDGFDALSGTYVYARARLENNYIFTFPGFEMMEPSIPDPITIQREFVHLPSKDYFVIHDKGSFNTNTRTRFQHIALSTTTPVWNGTYLVSSNAGNLGTSKLFVTPVLPAAANLVVTIGNSCSDSTGGLTTTGCQNSGYPTNSTQPATPPNGEQDTVYAVNDGWGGSGSLTSIGVASAVCTVTTAGSNGVHTMLTGVGHGLGTTIWVSGASDASVNVSNVTPNDPGSDGTTFTYSCPGASNGSHTESTLQITFNRPYSHTIWNYLAQAPSTTSGIMGVVGWKNTFDLVASAAAARGEQLYCMQAADSTTSIPTPCNKITSTSDLILAQFADSGGDWVVGFQNDIPQVAAVTLPVSYTIVGAGSSGTHILTGFAPSTTVKVAGSGNETIAITASGAGTAVSITANGVLAFAASGSTITPLNIGAAPGGLQILANTQKFGQHFTF